METIEIPKQYRVYNGECGHCKAHIHTDYEVIPKVRKFRFSCPGCGKEISVERNPKDNLDIENTEEKRNDKPRRKRKSS